MAIYVMLLCVTDYAMCYVTGCSKLTSKYVNTLILTTDPSGFALGSLFRHMIKSKLG